MIITSKRKLTSSVAVLCALMILIGIFPMNLFSGKKADAASITLESKYVYLDISNFSDEWNNNVYMFVDTWGTLQKGEKISGTDIIRWDKSGWGNIGHIFGFSCFDNWSDIKAQDYRRTTMTSINLSDAGAKYFYWDGSSTAIIDSKTVYSISVSDTPISKSLEGKTINFKDMTGKLAGNITAIFTGAEVTETSSSLTNNQITIPNDINDKPYTTVEFKNGDTSLGKYNLFNENSSGVTPISYDENTCNTFYYGATENLSNNSVISYWGAEPSTASDSINNNKLYLDKFFFDTTSGVVPTITIKDSNGTFTKDSDDDSTYSYIINTSATQQDIISVTYNNMRYNFLWSDLSKNKLSINGSIASISGVYSNSDGLDLYFDATLSKLSYLGSTGNNATMPIQDSNAKMFVHLFGATDGSTVGYEMTKLSSKTVDSNTWSDVYFVNISK